MKLPSARTAEIIEQDLGSELLIYDLRTNKAYTLNGTSMKVYRACAAAQTFGDLSRRYKFTADLIHLALGELQNNSLITGYAGTHFAGLSRRQVIRRVGLASMIALPVIAGIVAPTAVQAASGRCTQDSDCPPAGSPCKTNICEAGACVTRTTNYGKAVAGGVCDGNGNIVQCIFPTNCLGQDTDCQRRTCVNYRCGTEFAPAGTTTSAGIRYICDGAGGVVDRCPQSNNPNNCV